MVRTRRQSHQMPAMTMLLLVLLATVPIFKVSSSTETAGDQNIAASQAMVTPLMPAQLPAAESTNLQPQASADAVTSAQTPVAQLIPPPDGLQSVSFTLDEGGAKRPQSGGANLLASGTYTANGRVIVVSTFQNDPSGAASSLGAQSIALADGTPAWATTGPHGNAPNQVALLRDGLIVTLSGDLSVDTLTALASNIVVRW